MRVTTPSRRLSRQERILAALTAAGVTAPPGQLPIIDLASDGLAVFEFFNAVLAAGHTETVRASWPSDGILEDVGEVLYRGGDTEGVYRLPDGLVALVRVHDGWATCHVAAPARDVAQLAVEAFQAQYPPLYLTVGDDLTVPVTFWMLGRYGPERRLRRVQGVRWDAIGMNYTADVLAGLDALISDDFQAGEKGQLLLWHGPPGTGKTWAIRALADAWAPWAEFHYITDPDAFFVADASYMVDVLLHESYEAITTEGDVVTVEGDKWRVLVLEDTGELLSADAKEKSGQGLSRLLNVVDGLIGQGLRILVLVTTNDEIETLHPAVVRPGRCCSQILFGPLSAQEASDWAGEAIDRPMTLAELYARSEDAQEAFGGADTPEGHQEAQDPAGPAVEPPGGPAVPDTSGLDPLTLAAVEAARLPLPELDDDPAPVLAPQDEAVLVAALQEPGADPLAAAIAAIAASHRTSTDAIVAVLASRPGAANDDLARAALDLARELAARPAPLPAAAPDVHVHMPEQPVAVTVEGAHVDVHVPEQPAPVVNIEPAATQVDVHVAAAEAVPAAVHVHVPEQAAVEPVVHVHVPAPAPAPPRIVRSVEEADGSRTLVVEDAVYDVGE